MINEYKASDFANEALAKNDWKGLLEDVFKVHAETEQVKEDLREIVFLINLAFSDLINFDRDDVDKDTDTPGRQYGPRWTYTSV